MTATDPFVGTWRLNAEKSQFDANHRPTDATIVFELDANGQYEMRAEGVNQQGEKVAERPQRFVPDGKAYPVPDLFGLTAIATRPNPHTLQTEVRREDGSKVGGGTFVVSPDGRTLTATTAGYDTQLREFRQQTTFDRVT